MARSIETCHGQTFKVGDKVKSRTHGTVIRVEGAAIFRNYFNAEDCDKVPANTPTTAEVHAAGLAAANADAAAHGEAPIKPVSGGQSDGDWHRLGRIGGHTGSHITGLRQV